MGNIIAVANQKGGVGKTTTALAVADNLIKRGKKVLFLDTDPQRNSSAVYKAEIEDTATLYDLLLADTPIEECIQHTEYGDIIASDEHLMNADNEIPINLVGRMKLIKKAIKEIKDDYDYIIIDTMPHMSILLANVLMCANYIIVPVTSDFFSTQGLYDFYENVKQFQEDDNPDLKVLGLLRIRYKGRQNLTQSVDEGVLPDVAKMLDTKIFDTVIRESVKCQEAQVMRIPLFTYDRHCSTARDYDNFVEKEIIEKGI